MEDCFFMKFSMTSVLKVGTQISMPNLSEFFFVWICNRLWKFIFSGKLMMCRLVYNHLLVDSEILTLPLEAIC
jgi:hypothetical protein